MQYNRIKRSSELAAEIERQLDGDPKGRLYKKLYTVLLVAKHPDNNCSEVARQLGYSTHTVARWVRSVCSDDRFDLRGLKDKEKSGRRKRLTSSQQNIINDLLGKSPEANSTKKWTGKLLSDYILKRFKVELQIRQCQKIIRQRHTQK